MCFSFSRLFPPLPAALAFAEAEWSESYHATAMWHRTPQIVRCEKHLSLAMRTPLSYKGNHSLVDVSDIFNFLFAAQRRGTGSPGRQGAVCGKFGGGGLKFYFGAVAPSKLSVQKSNVISCGAGGLRYEKKAHFQHRAMRNACGSDSRWCLACNASAWDASRRLRNPGFENPSVHKLPTPPSYMRENGTICVFCIFVPVL